MDDELRQLRIEDHEFQEGLLEAAAQSERAKRHLDEVVLEFMHRGDTIRIAVGPRAWIGKIVHVGRSLLRLETAGAAWIDIDLLKVTSIAVVSRSAAGGRSPGIGDPATLIARLRELEQNTAVVEIGGPLLESLPVRILVVAGEHIEAEGIDGTEWTFPMHSIAFVIDVARPT
jgi:hypothetical protein